MSSSWQTTFSEHDSEVTQDTSTTYLPKRPLTDPVIETVTEEMRDPDPPTRVQARKHLIPVSVSDHDAVCEECRRYVVICPDGVERGHCKVRAPGRCSHRPTACDPNRGGGR